MQLSGKRNKYIPPRGFIYTGSPANANDYFEQGRNQVELLKKELLLQPNEYVLDVGSGIGRTAIALTQYLSSDGKYEGFDVVKKGVNWCNSKISKNFKNFYFKYIPLRNDLYNSVGQKASDFVFPYNDETFDKVFLFSVFTHMQINEIKNYLHEIDRVLKQGGMCLITIFTYTSKNEEYISNRSSFNFPIKRNGYRLMSDKVKSANVAISIDNLNKMLSDTSLIQSKLIDGFWKLEERKDGNSEFQDILILRKLKN
ncbi:class I SAM-dependent methyltransferase [Draconibacterium sp.]